ncbi:MAG: MBL fold metallo-hydrolase, partial [Thermococcus sp.]
MVKARVEKLCTDPEIYIIRIDDDEIKYFEAAWYIPEGITYNAYLLKLDGANVLVDLTKAEYTDLFLEELKKLVDPKEITHVILNHTEPDHSGALPAFL